MGSAHRTAHAAPQPGGRRRRRGSRTLSPARCAVAERPVDDALAGVHAVRRGGPGYPGALADLADAPAVLYLRGAPVPPPGRCVAIVGSRAASDYGRTFATRLAQDLAALGITVVSGLARGIDAAAHRGALAAGGRTIAVVPSGLDTVTPPGHDALALAILGAGTLVSEVASGLPFGRGAFVKRNRLIAALASVTVVVEAAATSGALSTAAVALRLGRGLCAVPGDLDRPTAHGVLRLLRSGARACGDASDVLAVRPAALVRPCTGAPEAAEPLERLAAALADEPLDVESLASAAALSIGEALALLLRLRWAGVAREAGGGRWCRATAGRP